MSYNTVIEWARQNAARKIERDNKKGKSEYEQNPIKGIINARRKQNRDIRILITGKVGTGKSSLGLQICLNSDKKFKKFPQEAIDQNVHFQAKEFIESTSLLPNNSGLLLDEGINAAFARSYMSTQNAYMSKVFATFRYKKFLTIICVPSLNLLDKNLRILADILIICEAQGKGKVYKIQPSKFGGDPWYETIIDELTWNKPPKKLFTLYEEKKFKIQDKEYIGYASHLGSKRQMEKTDTELLLDMHEKKEQLFSVSNTLSVLDVQNVTQTGRDKSYRLMRAYEQKYGTPEK